MAIALGACLIGVGLRAAETNAVIEATGAAETNTVCDAVDAMSPELRAWIVWMNDFVQKSGLKADVDEKGMVRMRFGSLSMWSRGSMRKTATGQFTFVRQPIAAN